MDGKKKNKKKKAKQNKGIEDASSNSKEATVHEPIKEFVQEENHSGHNSVSMDVQSAGISESDMEQEKHKINEVENVLSLEVKLEEVVKQLQDERDSWLQKQISFEEKISVIQKDVNSFIQKESTLEEKLGEFQMKNDSLIQKQAIVEDKFKDIDSIKESLILKEISLKELIAGIEEANVLLQMQVKELEVSRNNVIEENKRLMESISQLESRVEFLERDSSSHGDLIVKMNQFSQQEIPVKHVGVDAVCDKQITESPELTVKVSEVHTGKDQDGPIAAEFPSAELNHIGVQDETQLSEGMQIIISDNSVNNFVSESFVHPRPPPGLDEPRISEEIVAVPLDEIQIHEDEPQGVTNNDKPEDVPFSDAPLIGAPFRLISFVAKYVSGADLVSQKHSSPRS